MIFFYKTPLLRQFSLLTWRQILFPKRLDFQMHPQKHSNVHLCAVKRHMRLWRCHKNERQELTWKNAYLSFSLKCYRHLHFYIYLFTRQPGREAPGHPFAAARRDTFLNSSKYDLLVFLFSFLLEQLRKQSASDANHLCIFNPFNSESSKVRERETGVGDR